MKRSLIENDDQKLVDERNEASLRVKSEQLSSKKFKETPSLVLDHSMKKDSSPLLRTIETTTTDHSHLLLPEIIFKIMQFLDERSRCLNCRLICSQYEAAYIELSKIELLELWNQLNSCCLVPLKEEAPSQEEIEKLELCFNFKLSWHWKTFLSQTNGRPNWNLKLVHPSNIIYPIEEWDYLSNITRDHFGLANKDACICIGRLSTEKLLIMDIMTQVLYLTKGMNQFEQLGLLKTWFSDLRKAIAPIGEFVRIYGISELNVKYAKECNTVERALELISKNPFYYTVFNKNLKCNLQIVKSMIPYHSMLLDISFKKNKEFILQHLNQSMNLFIHAVRELKRDVDLQNAFVFIAKRTNNQYLSFYVNANLNQPEDLLQQLIQPNVQDFSYD
ncbi:hypothetical protein C9374_001310 [Naegleria lovaniensis]|uniref:F-box domain-containing protein n=1 Tax=Naegleria lovaniensis TaxID=51637 RepID=A0AA88KNL3_NAELO|nr:uncharacterized protein C9374_001310 [Naegleria lovaniensis]KAG2387716.1 hypothetical protein C9374_001310 [Naegleria lovaniensis]